MGRKILFITTDQQRFDELGCNGGKYAKTPIADSLAAQGINYQRAHCNNVVCMPARATMVTGYGQPKYESDDDRIIRTHKGEIVTLRCDYLFPFEREGYEAGNVVEEVIKKRKREKEEQPEVQEEVQDDEDTVVQGRRSGRRRQEVRSDSEEGECGDTEGEDEALADMKNKVKLTVTAANSEYGGSPPAPTQEEERGATEFVFDEEDIHQDVGERVSEDRSVRESSMVPTDDVGEQESMEVEHGSGSGIKQRRHLLMRNTKTPLCNLWLSLLQGSGASAKSLGDSTGIIEEL